MQATRTETAKITSEKVAIDVFPQRITTIFLMVSMSYSLSSMMQLFFQFRVFFFFSIAKSQVINDFGLVPKGKVANWRFFIFMTQA